MAQPLDPSHPLLTQAKRTLTLPTLPAYAHTLIRSLIREIYGLHTSVTSLLSPYSGSFNPASDPATACALLVNHLSMRRVKRVLCAYHAVRVGRLERAVWEGRDEVLLRGGGVGDSRGDGATDNAEGAANGAGGEGGAEGSALSPEEEEYLRSYGELVAALKGRWTDVDLTGSLEPPRDLFIDVRVVRDAGVIETEYGSINLTKNSQFYVRQVDVERLIQQGYLQRLD